MENNLESRIKYKEFSKEFNLRIDFYKINLNTKNIIAKIYKEKYY
jgi:hypothetical protein